MTTPTADDTGGDSGAAGSGPGEGSAAGATGSANDPGRAGGGHGDGEPPRPPRDTRGGNDDRDDNGHRKTDGADPAGSSDDEFGYDVEGNRRLRAEAERGHRSLHGTIGMGDDSITIGGSVGTININPGRRVGPRAREVGAGTIARLRTVLVEYSPAPGVATSRQRLADRLRYSPVGLLVGPDGSGRTSLALCALADILPEGAGVALFDPGTDPGRLTATDLRAGYGYVLDVTAAARRDGFDLLVDELTRLARFQRAWFVLAIDAAVGATVLTGGDVVRHEMPERADVLKILLDRQYACRADQISGLPPSVFSALDGAPLRRVAQIAALVAAALRDRAPADAYLDKQVRRQTAGLLADPLRGIAQEDLPRSAEAVRLFRRAFLVALAVCNDMPLDLVIRAANRLRDVLTDGRPGMRVGTSFTEPTAALLVWVEASPVDRDEDDTPAGNAGRVRFRNPAMAGAVLDLVWDEHHLTQTALRHWLTELALVGAHGAEPEAVRLRAAQAVGRFATHDFDLIMAELVEPWIRRNRSGQRAAAWTVEAMIGYPLITDRAWERVQRWSGQGDRWRTAALLVYATAPGASRTGEALELVRRTAAVPFRQNRQPLAFAMEVVYAVASAGGMEQVFDLLDQWVQEIEQVRERIIRLRLRGSYETQLRIRPPTVFYYAAGCLLYLASDDGPDGGTRWALNGHVGTDPHRQKIHDELWRLLLTAPVLATLGWPLLRTWCEEADTKPERAEATVDLLIRLTNHGELVKRLRFYADLWWADWRTSGDHPAAQSLINDIFGPMGAQ
ncbi:MULTISPECIES: ATP-binding protein [unclassified Frankia]|uniref:ATP-binding protein n=1 Tax=unclassified Frankia TaxID=2632575 RepID=UPI002AD4A18F|nr:MULTISPECIES: ATP-binding protein [unclassified Frankia]